jgi:uncharacterized protein (DUF1330 family)
MAAYVIGNYTIINPEAYTEYPEKAAATITKYDGTTIVVAHDSVALEGKPRSIIVVVRFDSIEKAQRWYYSEEYQAIIHLRQDTSEGWITICPEFDFSMMLKKQL